MTKEQWLHNINLNKYRMIIYSRIFYPSKAYDIIKDDIKKLIKNAPAI